MTTQYIMKATHINTAPFGIVNWVVSGAPDMTGALSGYSMSDLTGIAVDYTTTVSALTTGASGTTLLVPQRYTPIDSSTIINWKFDSGSSPYANSGNGSALTISNFHGTPQNVTGLFGKAIGLISSTLSTGITSVNEITGTSLSISLWVKNHGTQTDLGPLIAKWYGATNVSPFNAFVIFLDGTSGDVTCQLTTGGTRHISATPPAIFQLEFGAWSLVSMTYDGANTRLYINGTLAVTTACTGNIDYGSHGAWTIGGFDADIGSDYIDASIDDVRIENTVRSQTYFETMYKNGIGFYDGSFGNPALTIIADGYANLPPAGVTGRLFLPTDGFTIMRDNGSIWKTFSDVSLSECGNRLTLTSGIPVTTTDQTSKSVIYFTPQDGNRIALYNGNNWGMFSVDEISLTLSGLTSDKNYDIFIYPNSGLPTLELSAAWTNDTTRADGLVRQNGVLVKSSDHTRRYIGSFRSTGTTTTEDSILKRFLWNLHRQNIRTMNVTDSTDSWTYASSTYRQANGNAANKFEYISGVDETILQAYVTTLSTSSSNIAVALGVGIDSTSVNSAQLYGGNSYSNTSQTISCKYDGYPGLGYHSIAWLESSGSTATFYGDAGNPSQFRFGMSGIITG